MIVFKCFWKILLSEKFSLALFYILFVVLIVFFTTSPPDYGDFIATRQNIAIIDEDETLLSVGLAAYLEESHNLVAVDNNQRAMEEALFFRTADYILTIPQGFEDTFLRDSSNARLENVKSPGSFAGFYIDGMIDNYLVTVLTYLNAGFEIQVAIQNTFDDLNQGINVEFLGGAVADAIEGFFRFMAFVLMITCLNFIAAVFVTFNKKDLKRRNDCSAMPLLNKNLQLTLGAASSAIFLWALAMGIGFIMYGGEMFEVAILLRMANSFVLLIVIVALAFFLGNVISNRHILAGLVQVMAMVFGFLTGIFIPLEILSEQVRMFSRLAPTYWYARGVETLSGVATVNSEILSTFFQGILIQLGFAVALISITLVIIRQKRNKALV